MAYIYTEIIVGSGCKMTRGVIGDMVVEWTSHELASRATFGLAPAEGLYI